MIFRDVGGSGLALRPILRISGIIVILGAFPARKTSPILGEHAATNTFFAVLHFNCFYLNVFLLGFFDFGCQETTFYFLFVCFVGSPGLLKNH